MKKKKLKFSDDIVQAIHPGEMLQEVIESLGISQRQLARHMGIDINKINEICRGRRGISADMAVGFGRVFSTSPEMWLNAQRDWELSQVDCTKYQHLGQIKRAA